MKVSIAVVMTNIFVFVKLCYIEKKIFLLQVLKEKLIGEWKLILAILLTLGKIPQIHKVQSIEPVPSVFLVSCGLILRYLVT